MIITLKLRVLRGASLPNCGMNHQDLPFGTFKCIDLSSMARCFWLGYLKVPTSHTIKMQPSRKGLYKQMQNCSYIICFDHSVCQNCQVNVQRSQWPQKLCSSQKIGLLQSKPRHIVGRLNFTIVH